MYYNEKQWKIKLRKFQNVTKNLHICNEKQSVKSFFEKVWTCVITELSLENVWTYTTTEQVLNNIYLNSSRNFIPPLVLSIPLSLPSPCNGVLTPSAAKATPPQIGKPPPSPKILPPPLPSWRMGHALPVFQICFTYFHNLPYSPATSYSLWIYNIFENFISWFVN